MSKQPYNEYLDGRDPGLLVAEFPARLLDVLERLGADGMGLSLGAGKWTVAQTLCHLADTEIAFSFRWRQALADDSLVVQTFDQDLWAPRYPSIPGEDALRTWQALRQWNVVLLERLMPGDWQRAVIHPEQGPLTFRAMVEIMAGHDLHHLAQFEKIFAGQSTITKA